MMKKIYLLFIGILGTSIANAQVDVTFRVDMNSQTISPNGVHVTGSWQSEATDTTDWVPGYSPMSDDDLDGIYELQVNIPAGNYEYKFINGNDFGPGLDELVSDACGAYSNRLMTISSNIVLPAVCFSRCLSCGNNAIKLAVTETPSTNIGIGGSYSQNPFVDIQTLTDVNLSGIYTGLISVPNFESNEVIAYRFYDNPATEYENFAGDCLDTGGNRTFTFPLVDGLPKGDFIIPAVIWNSCESPSVDVTVSVDMSNYELCFGQIVNDTVNLTGLLGDGWGTTTIMLDPENDGIYEVTVNKAPDNYEYKFRVNGSYESQPNRSANVVPGGPIDLPTYCFGTEAEGSCVPNPIAPSIITFKVQPVAAVPANQKLWIFGDFTFNTFQNGAVEMSDADDNGIWETNQLICNTNAFYKFAIGDEYNPSDSTTVWSEENADFSAIGGCGEDNEGGNTDNRLLTRTDAVPFTVCYIYNTCDACSIIESLNENALSNSISISPNPFSAQTFINIDNRDGSALSVNVVDITGKMVRSTTNILGNRATVDRKDLSSGVYFLQIFSENGQKAVKKLIVQ